MSASRISAFGSLKIYHLISGEDFDIIEVSRLKDAVSAISAIGLAKKKTSSQPKIFFRVKPNTPVPMSIVNDIKQGVDLWIFESQRLADLYPDDLKAKIVVAPTPSKTQFGSEGTIAKPNLSASPGFLWIGDINNPARLRAAIEEIDALDGATLTICGTGKAAEVMPVVRMCRHLPSAPRIKWKGEQFDPATEISKSIALVASDSDITTTERYAMYSGRCILTPEEIHAFAETPCMCADTKLGDDIRSQVEMYRNHAH